MNKPEKLEVVLRIKNNTNLTQPVEIMSALANPYSSSGSNNLYTWDLSTETFVKITSVQLNYKLAGSGFGLSTPLLPLTTLSIVGIVDALNTTGLAIFQYDGTTIYSSSNTYEFRALETL